MARIEKTVFISYRHTDQYIALAVYQALKDSGYDVFFDYTSIPSGDFEQVIVSNIKARAHFVLILTPTSLDRCSETGDWLRREIETAIDENRNIIPLFFEGFNFGSPSVSKKLTGKMANLSRYNGFDVYPGYFMEGMERLCSNRFLNVPLDAVIHPVSTEVQRKVKKEKVAANNAIRHREDIKELIKPAEEKSERVVDITEEQKKVADGLGVEDPSLDSNLSFIERLIGSLVYAFGVFLAISVIDYIVLLIFPSWESNETFLIIAGLIVIVGSLTGLMYGWEEGIKW